jgi:membrane-bound lytic murein transglycosylase F
MNFIKRFVLLPLLIAPPIPAALAETPACAPAPAQEKVDAALKLKQAEVAVERAVAELAEVTKIKEQRAAEHQKAKERLAPAEKARKQAKEKMEIAVKKATEAIDTITAVSRQVDESQAALSNATDATREALQKKHRTLLENQAAAEQKLKEALRKEDDSKRELAMAEEASEEIQTLLKETAQVLDIAEQELRMKNQAASDARKALDSLRIKGR